jgi:hypothetical protein
MQSRGGCVTERGTGADAVSTLGSGADPVGGCKCFVVRAKPKHDAAKFLLMWTDIVCFSLPEGASRLEKFNSWVNHRE